MTKARLRRECASLDQLRELINKQASSSAVETDQTKPPSRHPRWVRINTLRTTLDEQLQTTFSDYDRLANLSKLTQSTPDGTNKRLHLDDHIPNLLAIPPYIDLTTTKAYKQGHLILQDKASCFPAHLLNPQHGEGDIIDACAAPGNKTTHLAAILHTSSTNGEDGDARSGKVIACEKDALRSQTLEKMIRVAGGEDAIRVKAKQDFMKLDPMAKEFADVRSLLLDPSCSGSGIVGRDEGGVVVHLPSVTTAAEDEKLRGKKRKRKNGDGGTRTQPTSAPNPGIPPAEEVVEELPPSTEDTDTRLQTRLSNLSSFQLRLLQRAMSFPSATRITYSTCSIHAEENEHVVVRALLSDIALERGWRIMKRSEQVEGMRKWHRRGWTGACRTVVGQERGEGCGVLMWRK